MNEVLKLQKHLMKFTMECFWKVPEDESALLYDEKGNKIHVPSFLDDDELFMDDDEEKFSSLLPTDWLEDSTIPKGTVEHHLAYWTRFIEKLLESIDWEG